MSRIFKKTISLLFAACLLFSGNGDFCQVIYAGGEGMLRALRTAELVATDDNTYRITVSYRGDVGIPEDAELKVLEISDEEDPSGLSYEDYVYRSVDLLEKNSQELFLAKAFDISLVDPLTGVSYQPDSDVQVSIELLDTVLEDGKALDVVHFGETAELMDAVKSGNSVEFDTDGFSVYVVIVSEGGEIQEPRVEFHFIGSDYVDNGDGSYTADPYSFVNTSDDHDTTGSDPTNVQTSQILRHNEALENIPNPENLIVYDTDGTTILSSKYFFGWYIVGDVSVLSDGKLRYDWGADPEQALLGENMTISNIVWADAGHTAISSLEWTMNGVSHTVSASENDEANNHIVLDKYGVVHVYLAPIYEDYYFVNFHLGAKETAKDENSEWDHAGTWSNLLTRRLVVLGSNGKADVRIALTAPPTDAKRHVFSGWETTTVFPKTEIIDGESVVINYPLDRVNLYSTVDPVTGQELNSPGHDDGYYITVGRDATIAGCDEVFGSGKVLDLYPVFAEARWIYFDIGQNGNGATYVGAEYLLTSDGIEGQYYLSGLPGSVKNDEAGYVAVKRNGYIFEGWYYGAVRDGEGNISNLGQAVKIADADGSLIDVGEIKNGNNETVFKIEGGRLFLYKALDELMLYANWEPVEDTVVQINVWRQKVSDDKDAAAADRTYDYWKDYSYKVSASSGWTLAQLRNNNKLHVGGTAAGANVEALTVQGFTYRSTGMSTGRVLSNGSTVVDVYYDRDTITFNYYTYGYGGYSYTETTSNAAYPNQYAFLNGTAVLLERRNTGGNISWFVPEFAYQYEVDNNGAYGLVDGNYVPLDSGYSYQRSSYTLTRTTSDSGTQYGVVGGNIQRVYYRNWQWRQTNSNWGSVYYGHRYTQGDPPNGAYTGDRYRTITGTAGSGQSGFTMTTDLSGDVLFGNEADTYFPLQVSEVYSYNGVPYSGPRYSYVYKETGNRVEWTGARYTRTSTNGWGLYKKFTGLYAQTLTQNGYVWDTAYDWYSNPGNFGSPNGVRTTFLDAFLPTADTLTVNFYGASPGGSRTIYFYKQKINADGSVSAEYELANTVSTTSTAFNLSDKYDGFTCYAWKSGDYGALTPVGSLMLQNGNYYYDANPNQYGYQTASFSSSLHVYFNRNLSSISYVTQYPNNADLWDEGGTPSESLMSTGDVIPYGASLSGYGSGGANYWSPNVPAHYSFAGWYEDEAGTKKFNFNATMPSGDVIVYGKWDPERFRISIDPNGGVIDHVNHWGAVDFELIAANTQQYASSSGAYAPFDTFRPLDAGSNPTEAEKYEPGMATFFKNDYGQTISEYGGLVRDYVQITETEANAMRAAYANAVTDEERAANTVYCYINTQYYDGLDIPGDLRNALYLAESEVEEYFAFFRAASAAAGGTAYGADDIESWKHDFFAQDDEGDYLLYRHRNNKEFYTLVGWFRVLPDGTEESTPYNFADLTRSDVKLRAEWRLDGGYIIQYTPEQTINGKLINGDMEAWTDPVTSEGSYTDGAKTSIYRQPDNITEDGNLSEGGKYDFIGWRLVSRKIGSEGTIVYIPLEANVYYQPGDEWIVKASYADSNSIIHMQAVYQLKSESIRRPEVVNLTLDANTGYLVDENGAEISSDRNLDWNGPGAVTMDAASDTLSFGDIQSNTAVHLYRYATELQDDAQGRTLVPPGTNYFKHDNRYLLIGFDDASDEGDYVADHTADSVISLSRTDNITLYAVWEPMVYITLKNETRDDDNFVAGGPVSFSLSSASSEALTVINIKDGRYKRVPLASISNITLDVGEELLLAIPLGKDKDITISGTNNIGPGSILYVSSTVEGSYSSAVRTEDPAEVVADNNKTFSITDYLIEQRQGIIVSFTSDMHDRTIVFDQNFGNNETSEIYFSNAAVVSGSGSVTMPYPNTNFGFELQGWALTRSASVPAYPADYVLTGEEFTEFFGDDNIKTLYAVWKGKEEAGRVYVYKTVPSPGSQNEEFSFTVNMAARFDYQLATGTSDISLSDSFVLKSNEYALVETEQYLGRPMSGDDPAKAYLRFTVKVYYEDDNGNWVVDASRGKDKIDYADLADSGQFLNEYYAFSIEEEAVQHYTPALDLTSQLTKLSESKLAWSIPDAGGTARFTNTHETHTVTVKKALLPSNATEEAFAFYAFYKLKNDDIVSLGAFHLAGGYQHELTGIPSGAVLTLSEIPNADYSTAAASEKGKTDLDPADNVFRCAVTEGDTVNFTNTLKSFPVKIVLMGFDGTTTYTNVNAQFSLTKGSSSVFSGRSVNSQNNVVYNTGTAFSATSPADGELYIGSYTLKEIWLETNYMALTPEFPINITKDGVTIPGAPAGVALSTEGSGSGTKYVITVTNRKTASVTIAKTLVDPLISTTLDFSFKVAYYLDGVGGAVTSTVNVTSSDARTFKVPLNSKLVIEEDIDKEVNDQKISDRYDTSYRVGTGPVVEDYRYVNEALAASLVISFTNSFKTSDITVTKQLEESGDTNIFTFTATLLVGTRPIKSCTVWDNGNGVSDLGVDLITDNNGQVSFELSGDESRVLSIPIGARLRIAETSAKTEGGAAADLGVYTTAVSVTYSSDSTPYGGAYSYEQALKTCLFTSVPARNLTLTFINGLGVAVYFKKTDGFGNGLGGAEFTLYKSYEGALNKSPADVVSLTVGDAPATAVNSALAASGTVNIGDVNFKAPVGTWYIRETLSPDSTKYTENTGIYRIVITGNDNIAIRRMLNATTSDPAGPDIANYGIMNISLASRRAVLKKTDNSFAPLSGAAFDILRCDYTAVARDQVSGNGGAVWIGELPYGKYYLHETGYPAGVVQNGADGWWYTLTVDASGVSCSGRSPAAP